MPVIPTVLLNGVDGVGTGFSTSIPRYHPLEVVANVRRAIAGERMRPMAPWTLGFQGDTLPVDRSSSASASASSSSPSSSSSSASSSASSPPSSFPTSFVTRGRVARISPTELEITELPLGRWTQDYKVVLEQLIASSVHVPLPAPFVAASSPSASTKSQKSGAKKSGGTDAAVASSSASAREDPSVLHLGIKSYTEHHSDRFVHFRLQVDSRLPSPPVGADRNDPALLALAASLRLETTLATSNMHLFDAGGRIRRYEAPTDIIAEFVPYRLKFYEMCAL